MSQRGFALIIIIIAVIIVGGILFWFNLTNKEVENKSLEAPTTMKITSQTFKDRELIPSKYTCDGENVNPPLQFFDVPKNGKSLALIMDDPDAPRDTWVHWLIWNMEPETTEIPEHSAPKGAVEGKTSFGKPGYGGPCPPSGTHRYFFKAYALDTMLDISPDTDKAGLEKAMEGHILAKGELVGLYSRNK